MIEIHSYNKHLLISYYVPGAWDRAMDRTAPCEADSMEPPATTEPVIMCLMNVCFVSVVCVTSILDYSYKSLISSPPDSLDFAVESAPIFPQ